MTNVRIQADVPPELTVTAVNSPLGSSHQQEGQIIKFDPINLEPGQEARFVVSVRANKAGDLRFKVEMYADQLTSGKPVYREASTTVANKLQNGQAKPQKRIIEGP